MFWRRPAWDWLQVEVTTRCNAACTYCPHTLLRPSWRSRDLAPEVFERLRPWFGRCRHVHLQGWGEPLKHPDFFRFLEAVKAAGATAGCTTNGTLADEVTLARLVASGLDVLALSLAGTGPGHDRARPGAGLTAVLHALERVARAKREAGTDRPDVHIAYLLLRSNLDEFDRLPELLAGRGVASVVVSTLDAVYAPEMAAEAFFPIEPGEREVLAARVIVVAERCRALGITVHGQLPLASGAGNGCPEHPTRAATITVDGDVAPCVFAALPVPEEIVPRRTFGNVREHSLAEIWRSPAYRTFRRALADGRPPASCAACAKWHLGPI